MYLKKNYFFNIMGPSIWYTNIFVTLPKDVMKHIIGKNGSNFAKFSKKLALQYIWFNSDTNALTLYGEPDKLDVAKMHMYELIESAVKQYAPDLITNMYNNNPIEDVMTNISLENVIEKEKCKYLIGINGKNFNKITRDSNIYFMWYDNTTHSIKLYGTKYHTLKAIEKVYDRVKIIKDFNNEKEDNESKTN